MRFSHEDFVANSIGAGLGWFFASNPEWDDRIDFRLAYRATRLSSNSCRSNPLAN